MRTFSLLLLVAIGLGCSEPTASSWSDPGVAFVGRWETPDRSDTTAAEITAQGDRLSIEIWGNCTPEPCEWGAVPMEVLVGNDVLSTDPKYGLAHWTLGETKRIVTVEGTEASLQLTINTLFFDDSGRPNYRSVVKLRRPGQSAAATSSDAS